jgi:hypothetical protein
MTEILPGYYEKDCVFWLEDSAVSSLEKVGQGITLYVHLK